MSMTPAAEPVPAVPASLSGSTSVKSGFVAWSALVLGAVGVLGSPVLALNKATALAAAVGLILGILALFGARPVLAFAAVILAVAAMVFTVGAREPAFEEFHRIIGAPTSSQDRADQTAAP